MRDISVEELLTRTGGSIYKLVILASKRAQELSSGSEKLVNASPNTKITTIALREIQENKISIKPTKKAS